MNRILPVIAIMFISAACHRHDDWGANNGERDKILNHYSKNSRQRKAAEFLVDNMTFHSSYDAAALENLRDIVLAQPDSLPAYLTPAMLDSLWNEANPVNKQVRMRRDNEYVTADFLISDIDMAFDNWEKSPWRDSISFDIFLNNILPYNASHEPLIPRRQILRERYLPLIEGVDDPRKAFEIVSVYVIENFKVVNDLKSYMDPLIMNKIMQGDCNQRSTYLINVMRSLNIPVVYEHIMRSANYSTPTPHSWVAFYESDSVVYVIPDGDSVMLKNSKVHYEKFHRRIDYDDTKSLYKVDMAKLIFKMWRNTYTTNIRKNVRYDDPNLSIDLVNPNRTDISRLYGMDKTLMVYSEKKDRGNAYLFNFGTGEGWLPFDVAAPKGKKVQFDNINHGICYLPAFMTDDKKIEPITNPVIINKDGSLRFLDPSDETESVTLRRKYLLIGQSIFEWNYSLNSVFEGTNVRGFKDISDIETLYKITEIPIGVTNINIESHIPYRYVRFRSSQRRLRMAEIAFFGMDGNGKEIELTGEFIWDSIPQEYARNIIDKNYETDTQPVRGVINPTPYWIGYDLGEGSKIKVSRISFSTYSDTNFIYPGDEYELFYYDMGWISLGRRVADSEYLVYDNVPKNSLMWLRNHTKGREERPFTYENGKQIWW